MMDLIYLLEDDDSIRKLVIYALNSQGYEAKGFERPAEFWKAMGQAQPDLVLLDIMLPEEDGLTILQKLRAAAGTKKLPIIMLTAKNTEYDRVVGLDSGADDFISKPFGMMELVARVRAVLRRTESIYAQLMQTIVRQEGLDGICETLHSVTGQEIVILSASGKQILAKCVGQYGDEDLDEDQLEFIRYFFEQSAGQRRLRELKPNQCGNLILGERHALCVPNYAQTEKIAYLLLSCTQWHIPDMDVIAFEHASSLIAIELLKERALVDKEQKVREKLLEDVFMKRYADEQMLYRRGFSLGIDLKKPYAVFTIDPDEFEHFVRSEMRASTEAEVQTIKDGIQSIIYAEMTAWPHPTLLMNSSVRVYGLVTIRHTEDKAALQRVLGSIVRRLANFCPKLRFQIGISQVKSAVQDAPSAQQEAALAASCAKLPQFEKEDGIVFFENLGALRFLNELKDSSAMQSYYEEHMKALIDYDREHNTELVNTLECYFRCNRNLRVTAETLFIHKNSAIYRIRKIESLTGSSISAGADAFDLQMCLLLKTLFPADHA